MDSQSQRHVSTVTADEATQLILQGQAPAGMVVRGALRLANSNGPRSWRSLLSKKKRDPLRFDDPNAPPTLPERLSCSELDLSEQPITRLPAGLNVQFRLNLHGCTQLQSLPAGLKAGSLDLSGCTALESLPEDLETFFLDISDCPQLRTWPERGRLEFGRLRARNCTGLTSLPPWLAQLSQLDLAGCASLAQLPEGLQVDSWLDLAGTAIRELPASLADVPLRWRGVPIDARVAFRPEEITADEILAETNVELRRVKLERMGFEAFLQEARAELLDTDRDAGGERRLLRVPLENDEDLVCVSVFCPSTARQYVIRVPPNMTSCHQAIAWTAGFDDPSKYRPVVET